MDEASPPPFHSCFGRVKKQRSSQALSKSVTTHINFRHIPGTAAFWPAYFAFNSAGLTKVKEMVTLTLPAEPVH
jgi:hypothetical protein